MSCYLVSDYSTGCRRWAWSNDELASIDPGNTRSGQAVCDSGAGGVSSIGIALPAKDFQRTARPGFGARGLKFPERNFQSCQSYGRNSRTRLKMLHDRSLSHRSPSSASRFVWPLVQEPPVLGVALYYTPSLIFHSLLISCSVTALVRSPHRRYLQSVRENFSHFSLLWVSAESVSEGPR